MCYDDNLITIDGHTSLSFTEDVNKRYEAYGWHVQTVTDGTDVDALNAAIANAKAETNKPSIIKVSVLCPIFRGWFMDVLLLLIVDSHCDRSWQCG